MGSNLCFESSKVPWMLNKIYYYYRRVTCILIKIICLCCCSMPLELLLGIFGYLSVPDLLAVGQVCSLWHTIADDKYVNYLMMNNTVTSYCIKYIFTLASY